MDNESEVHNAAPADREGAKKATLLPLSRAHQRGGKAWEHNKQVCHRKRNTTATATDKHTMVWHEG